MAQSRSIRAFSASYSLISARNLASARTVLGKSSGKKTAIASLEYLANGLMYRLTEADVCDRPSHGRVRGGMVRKNANKASRSMRVPKRGKEREPRGSGHEHLESS